MLGLPECDVQKPARLRPGDSVAIVSPSSGGPSYAPHVFEAGLASLRSLGLNPIEMPHARSDDKVLHDSPRLRAEDVNQAFADPTVHAIITSIGGDDSVRILPFLDPVSIRHNPKVFMGLSDATTLVTHLNSLGLVTLYGPSVMVGLAQMSSLPAEFRLHVQQMLMKDTAGYQYRPYPCWTDGYLDWGEVANAPAVKALNPNDTGWVWLQGSGVASGTLWGGCMEVLEMMKGTAYWPSAEFWNGKVLFLETSEDKPTVQQVRYVLRNYGMQGVFERVHGLLIGRPRDYTQEEKARLSQTVVEVVAGEFGQCDLPVVANMDFGHTDPQFILPVGIAIEIDCRGRLIRLLDSALG